MPDRFQPKRQPLADVALDARIRHIESYLSHLGGSGINPNTQLNTKSPAPVPSGGGGGGGGGGSSVLAGDVTGPAVSNTVSFLQGTTLTLSTATAGDLLEYVGGATAYENTQALAGNYNLTGSASLGPLLKATPAADTALTAGTEFNDILWGLNRTQQWATGALATQRAAWFRKPTYAFVGASTATTVATVAIEGAPVAGANATFTNDWALWVMGDTSRFDGPVTCPGAGTSSERFGAGALAAGNNSVSVGNGASAAGLYNTAAGLQALTSGNYATALGGDAQAQAAQSTAVGVSSRANTINCTAFGFQATANNVNSCIAVGATTNITGAGAIGVGYGVLASAPYNVAMGHLANAGHNNAVCLGGVATSTAASQFIVGSSTAPVTDFYLGHGAVSATPPAASMNASGGSGTNIAGAPLTVAGGKSTGNAAGGTINLATSHAGTSGTGLNSLTTWWSLSSAGLVTLTDAVNYALGSTTGTQWGTATTQKQGWYGVTPVVQQANASQATINLVTDANAKAALQSIYNALKNLGLCAATA